MDKICQMFFFASELLLQNIFDLLLLLEPYNYSTTKALLYC